MTTVSAIESRQLAELPELETDTAYRARIKKEKEAAEQRCLQAKLSYAMNSKKSEYIDKCDMTVSDIENTAVQVETGKNSDGSSKLKKPRSNSFWGKVKQWGSNALSAGGNMLKGFFGFDQDWNWDAKQFGINVLVTGGCVAACCIPYVGPVIALGLMGYGAYQGGKTIIEGNKDLKRATTDEEIDRAQQKICSGGLIAALSVFGIRGIGKGFRTNPATAAKASSAKAGTSWGGKVIEGSSNFIKDATINAVKATIHDAKSGTQILKSLPGLLKNFKASKSETETSLARRMAELDNKINAETNPAYKALYEEEFNMLKIQHDEITSLENLTQTELRNLSKKNASHKIEDRISSYEEVNGEIIIKNKGTTYKISKKDPLYKAFKKNINKSKKDYDKVLQDLIKNREQIMKKYAKDPDSYAAELDSYTQMSIRNKYKDPESLQTGIDVLEAKLSTTEGKIVEIEGKLVSATGKAAKRLRKQLKGLQKVQDNIENELAVCKSIKFKKWYKPSTWRKNKYQMALKGVKSPAFGELVRSRATTCGVLSASYMTGVVNPIYSDAYGYSTDLSPQQTEALIDLMSKYSEAFKIARNNLLEAQDDETIEKMSQALDIMEQKYEQEKQCILSGESPTQDAQNSQAEESQDNSSSAVTDEPQKDINEEESANQTAQD